MEHDKQESQHEGESRATSLEETNLKASNQAGLDRYRRDPDVFGVKIYTPRPNVVFGIWAGTESPAPKFHGEEHDTDSRFACLCKNEQ